MDTLISDSGLRAWDTTVPVFLAPSLWSLVTCVPGPSYSPAHWETQQGSARRTVQALPGLPRGPAHLRSPAHPGRPRPSPRGPAPAGSRPHLEHQQVAAGPADDAVGLLALAAALPGGVHKLEALGDATAALGRGQGRRGPGLPGSGLGPGAHKAAGGVAGHVAAGHQVELRFAVRGVGADALLALGGIDWGAGLGAQGGASEAGPTPRPRRLLPAQPHPRPMYLVLGILKDTHALGHLGEREQECGSDRPAAAWTLGPPRSEPEAAGESTSPRPPPQPRPPQAARGPSPSPASPAGPPTAGVEGAAPPR